MKETLVKTERVSLLRSFWGHRPRTQGIIKHYANGEAWLKLDGSKRARIWPHDLGELYKVE